MKPTAIIFDLDGTLIDSATDIGRSANAVLEQRSFPIHPISAYQEFTGSGLRVLFQRALPDSARDEATVDACMESFQHEYATRWNDHTRPYDGIPELLDRIQAAAIPMAILSNKPHAFTCQYADTLLGRWRFTAVLGQQVDLPRKPDPTAALQIGTTLDCGPAQILFMGDTIVDMETARRAGMVSVGALWGFRRVDLELADADHLIEHPLQCLRLLGLPHEAV